MSDNDEDKVYYAIKRISYSGGNCFIGFDVYNSGDGKSDWSGDGGPGQGSHVDCNRAYLTSKTVIFTDEQEAKDTLKKIHDEKREEEKMTLEEAGRRYQCRYKKDLKACNQKHLDATYFIRKMVKVYHYEYLSR
jgi:hypothetical protein